MNSQYIPLLIFVFSTLFGYLAGYGFRQMLAFFQPVRGVCNIAKKGKRMRAFLALAFLGLGYWFTLPILGFFAGFTWYECRSKWCIVESLRVQ